MSALNPGGGAKGVIAALAAATAFAIVARAPSPSVWLGRGQALSANAGAGESASAAGHPRVKAASRPERETLAPPPAPPLSLAAAEAQPEYRMRIAPPAPLRLGTESAAEVVRPGSGIASNLAGSADAGGAAAVLGNAPRLSSSNFGIGPAPPAPPAPIIVQAPRATPRVVAAVRPVVVAARPAPGPSEPPGGVPANAPAFRQSPLAIAALRLLIVGMVAAACGTVLSLLVSGTLGSPRLSGGLSSAALPLLVGLSLLVIAFVVIRFHARPFEAAANDTFEWLAYPDQASAKRVLPERAGGIVVASVTLSLLLSLWIGGLRSGLPVPIAPGGMLSLQLAGRGLRAASVMAAWREANQHRRAVQSMWFQLASAPCYALTAALCVLAASWLLERPNPVLGVPAASPIVSFAASDIERCADRLVVLCAVGALLDLVLTLLVLAMLRADIVRDRGKFSPRNVVAPDALRTRILLLDERPGLGAFDPVGLAFTQAARSQFGDRLDDWRLALDDLRAPTDRAIPRLLTAVARRRPVVDLIAALNAIHGQGPGRFPRREIERAFRGSLVRRVSDAHSAATSALALAKYMILLACLVYITAGALVGFYYWRLAVPTAQDTAASRQTVVSPSAP